MGDCHEYLARAPARDDFFESIANGLAEFPRLSSIVPKGFPRRGTAAVGYEKALLFEWERNKRYSHSINLPLLLHLVGNPCALDNLKQYAAGTLSVFERFISEFSSTPRMKTVVKPLWEQMWDREQVFWSVLAHCHIALGLKLSGDTIVAFEAPTGYGAKTADIHFRKPDGCDVLQEIEIWDVPEGSTAESVRMHLRSRATAKSATKFGEAPPPSIRCLVTQVAMPRDPMLAVLRAHQEELMKPFEIGANVWAELSAFVAVGDAQRRQIGHEFLRSGSPMRPVAPPQSDDTDVE